MAFLWHMPQEFLVRRTNSWSVVTSWCVAKRIPDAFLTRSCCVRAKKTPPRFSPLPVDVFRSPLPVNVSRCGFAAAPQTRNAADQLTQAHKHS